jgi:hypothetical protein
VPNNRRGRGLTNLLSEPKPLPDDDSEVTAPERIVVEAVDAPAEVRPAAVSAAQAETAIAQEPASLAPAPNARVEPPRRVEPIADRAPLNGSGGSQRGKRAATSIRIHQDVADELETAWLKAKSVDLRLSYSEYASRLLRRSLQDENKGA